MSIRPNESFQRRPRSREIREPVGRDGDVERLEELVGDAERLTTLTGPPGVGKTHLASVLADRLARERGFEIVRPDLQSVETLEGFRRAVGRSLGIDERNRAEERIAMAFSSRDRCLLLLDGVESLLRDAESREEFAEKLRDCRERAPQLRVLVVSRLRIGSPGEHCYDLPPLEVDSAVELFERRARQVRDGFAVDDANRETVRAIVEELDALPQAVELAAGRLRVLGVEQLRERLEQRGASGDAEEMFAPLDRALDEMWASLPGWARRAAGQLRAFRGRFSPEMADRVLELEGGPSGLRVLEFLVDCSLLETTSGESERGVQFRMLQTVRRYVGRVAEGAAEPAERRHAKSYASAAVDWWRERGSASGPEAKAALAAAESELRAGFERSVERGWGEAVELATGLLTHLTDCRYFDDAEAAFQRLRDSEVVGEEAGAWTRGMMAYAEACLRAVDGDFEQARSLAASARDRAREVDAPVLEARAEMLCGHVAFSAGDAGRANEHTETALEVLGDDGGVVDRIRVLHMEARICRQTDRQREAERQTRRALQLAEEHELPERRMRSRLHLGLLYAELERFDDAVEQMERAVEINDDLPPWARETFLPAIAATVHHTVGELERAERMFRRGVEASRRRGAFVSVADALVEYGYLLLELEEPGRARQAFVQSRRVSDGTHRASGYDLAGAQRLGEALTYLSEHRFAGAREQFERVEERLREIEEPERPGTDIFPSMADLGRAVLEVRRLRTRPAEQREERDLGTWVDRLEDRLAEAPASGISVNPYATLQRLAEEEIERARSLESVGEDWETPVVRVGEELQWLEVDGGERVDLSRRGALRRMLEALVEAHEEPPEEGESLTAYELLEAGWPEQPADLEAGKSRVYTNISRLRELGLEELLETTDEGYRLVSGLEVIREG